MPVRVSYHHLQVQSSLQSLQSVAHIKNFGALPSITVRGIRVPAKFKVQARWITSRYESTRVAHKKCDNTVDKKYRT